MDCKGGNRKAKVDTEHGRRCIRAWPLPRCGDKGEQRSGDRAAAPKPATRKMAVAGSGMDSEAVKHRNAEYGLRTQSDPNSAFTLL